MADLERTVRTVDTDAELRDYQRGMMTAFLAKRDVTDEWVAWARQHWDLSRTWAAFDGDVQCGTTRTFPTALRLPGLGTAVVSALTQVTVLPTHTRRGHLSRLMRAQLEAAVDAGEVASILVAAEWPIYGRFGYGPYCEWAEWEVDVPHADVLGEPVGSVEIIDPSELDEPAAEILAGQQAVTPGCIERDATARRRAIGVLAHPADEPDPKRIRILHRDPSGRPDGYAVYDPKERWEGMRPEATIKVEDLVYTDAVAERELLRYLLDVDLVGKVTYGGRTDSVVRHVLANGRAARQVGRWDYIWARLLDIPACLTARAYASDQRVVFEAVDPFLGRGGRFALDAGPDGATCEPTTESPGVTLPIAALGAAWLGGTDLRTLAAAGAIDEHVPGELDRLAATLRWHQVPWNHTDF